MIVQPPERRERAVEDRHLIVTLDEQRAAAVIHLVARAEIHVSERVNQIGEASRVNRKTRPPEDTAEDENVVYEVLTQNG